MRGVVTEGGATFLQDVPGDEVAAKTGTAQFGEAGNLQNHVWMIAIQGDLAVAVFVDVGEYGSTTAGPLLEQFLPARRRGDRRSTWRCESVGAMSDRGHPHPVRAHGRRRLVRGRRPDPAS